jgi:hypothetical protein
MKLYEFNKSPSDMTDDELEEHMLLLLDEMDMATNELIEHNKKVGNEYVFADNRVNNTQTAS